MKKHIFIGIGVSLLVACIVAWMIYGRYNYYKEIENNSLLQIAYSSKNNIETHLNNAESLSKTLSFIVENYGEPKDFDSIASQLIGESKIISAIELTDSGVIKKVFPLKGNENILGYDILGDTTRNIEAMIALRKRDFYFSGPFELKQGGFGIVGRMPIFNKEKFIGFSAVVINFDTLMKAVNILNPPNEKLMFQIVKTSPYTKQVEKFINDDVIFNNENIISLDIPIGSWKLKVANKEPIGIRTFSSSILFGLLLSILAGVFTAYVTYLPTRLKRLVEKKTEELRDQNARLRELTWMHSHIIRAPIARLLGLTSILNESEYLSETDKELVHYIRQSSEEFDKIIRNASEELESSTRN